MNSAIRFVLLLAMVILGTAALVHYFTPCASGTLCMALAAAPSQPGWLYRLRRWLAWHTYYPRQALRAHYLRMRIRAAEQDCEHICEVLAGLPEQVLMHRRSVAQWDVELIDCAKPRRPS